jgi:hypothetical protein
LVQWCDGENMGKVSWPYHNSPANYRSRVLRADLSKSGDGESLDQSSLQYSSQNVTIITSSKMALEFELDH